jgi:hypothetical protein
MLSSRWWFALSAIVGLTCGVSAQRGGSANAVKTPGSGLMGMWAISDAAPDASTRRTLTARLSADDAVAGAEHPELVLRCRGQVLDVYVDTKVVTSGVGNRLRWDDAPSQPYDVWSEPDADMRTLFTAEPEEFVRKAIRARRLRFEFKPAQGSPAVAEFRLAGLSGVLMRLQQACPTLVALH